MKLNSAKQKILLGAVLVSAITVAGIQSAGAGPWKGGPGYMGGPLSCGCEGYGDKGQQLDEKTEAARKAFLAETVEIRKQIATKRAEKRALMLNDNPNPKRVAELAGELFELREMLHSKAQEKGIDNYFSRGRGCGGPELKKF